jgi:hypothetical protein
MKSKLTYTFVILLFAVLTSGCVPTQYKTAKILKEDNAQIAITLNKGFETTVISTSDGKRIDPICITDKKAYQKQTSIPMCEDQMQAKKENKVLYEKTYNVTVIEGSICVRVKIGPAIYKFCDPPYDLGF